MSTLGLDIGTSGCKAAVFDAQGQLLAQVYREYPLIVPQAGWAELDSRRVCESCWAVVTEAATVCAGDPVRAMGVSSQGEAFTPVSGAGEILGNAMVSSDMRATSQVAEWAGKFGRDRLYSRTGHTPHPMFTLFKLDWLRHSQPDVWQRAARFLCFEDLFAHSLGIEPALGYPLAGRTMLFDVRKHAWDAEILGVLGLTPGHLGRPVPSGMVVGTIPRAVTKQLHLAEGAVLVAGGHDQPCGALGAGVIDDGVAMYASGTVECLCPAFGQAVFSPHLDAHNLCTYDYTVPGMYTTVAFSLTGGNLLKWFRDEWGEGERTRAAQTGGDVYALLLASMPDTPSGLLVLPYFTPSGTPYFDTVTPGGILGLRLSTKRGEVLKALMEGVALEMRLNLAILEEAGIAITELRAIGGGARNRTLLQLKANVLNRPISTVAVTEAGCLGTAMLAAAALTSADVRSVARAWVQTRDVVQPNPRYVDHYAKQFAAYRRAYGALAAFARQET